MADNWGDILGRGYRTGRAIGDDIATSRFARNAQKVKDEYEERAATEGKPLESYLPEIEQRLEELAVKVGATRRAISGQSGQALDREYLSRINEDIGRGSERRAGALALAGDQAGARDTRASTQYQMGRFDEGQGQQIAGDTIRATQGAMKPDGTYDMAGGAQALAGVGARYGNAEAANAQQQGAASFRLQAAQAKADAIFNMAQNPEAFTPDQFAGAWEGLKQNVPELKNTDLRKGEDNVLYLYTNGKATGSLDPKNKTDLDELSTIMAQFTKQPGEALQGYMGAKLKSIEEEKARGKETNKAYRDAFIKVITDAKSVGIPEGVASKLFSAGTGSSGGSGGWQLQEIGDEPGTYIMQKGGQVYQIKTNVAPDPATGEVGGALQVFTGDGQPVPASVLNRGDTAEIQGMVQAATTLAASGNRQQMEWVKTQLNMLNQLRGQELGLPSEGSSRGVAPGDPQETQKQYREIGEKHGFTISSMERPVLNIGAGVRSQHPKGTAVDYSVKGKTREQIDALIVDLQAAGYEVIDESDGRTGTGPHIHAELPKGARTAASPVSREAPAMGATEGAPPAQTSATAALPSMPASAPSAQTALPRRAAISPDFVKKSALELNSLRSEFEAKRDALAQFDEDFGTQVRGTTRSIPGGGYLPAKEVSGLDPTQARVRSRLAAEVEALEAQMQEATGELRSNTGALKRQAGVSRSKQDEEALYSKYGGAADFFRAAQ